MKHFDTAWVSLAVWRGRFNALDHSHVWFENLRGWNESWKVSARRRKRTQGYLHGYSMGEQNMTAWGDMLTSALFGSFQGLWIAYTTIDQNLNNPLHEEHRQGYLWKKAMDSALRMKVLPLQHLIAVIGDFVGGRQKKSKVKSKSVLFGLASILVPNPTFISAHSRCSHCYCTGASQCPLETK